MIPDPFGTPGFAHFTAHSGDCSFLKMLFSQSSRGIPRILSLELPPPVYSVLQILTALAPRNSSLCLPNSLKLPNSVLGPLSESQFRSFLEAESLRYGRAHFVCFSVLRDHSSELPVVQCLKITASYMVSSFLVVYRRG